MRAWPSRLQPFLGGDGVSEALARAGKTTYISGSYKNIGYCYPPCLGPWSQNAGSLCLCGLRGRNGPWCWARAMHQTPTRILTKHWLQLPTCNSAPQYCSCCYMTPLIQIFSIYLSIYNCHSVRAIAQFTIHSVSFLGNFEGMVRSFCSAMIRHQQAQTDKQTDGYVDRRYIDV